MTSLSLTPRIVLSCLLAFTAFCSANGSAPTSWTSQKLATTNILTGVTFGNGVYVIVGYSGELWTSPDTVTWTKQPFTDTMTFLDVAFGNGVFVAGGYQPYQFGTANVATIQSSTDGVSWTRTSQNTYSNGYGVDFVNDRFVVVGDGSQVDNSTDGYSWATAFNNSDYFPLFDTAYGAGYYLITSIDGIVRRVAQPPTTISILGGDFLQVGTSSDLLGAAFGNSTFVVVGMSGVIATSPDGATWTLQTSGTSNTLYDVAFGDGSFVAVGAGGIVLTSPDGISWTSQTSNTTELLRGVSFVNGSFIAVGTNGRVINSGGAASTGTVANISTRSFVQGGDNVMIAGVIVQDGSRKVVLRAIGPSLTAFGVPNALADPTLELREGSTLLATNNDWQTSQIGGLITGDQVAELQASGLQPGHSKEAAVIVTLPAGSYTAIVSGVGGTSGVGLVELYALP